MQNAKASRSVPRDALEDARPRIAEARVATIP
jgi:hypothetical protein